VNYQIQFDGDALIQLRGFPTDAFEALLARVVELVAAPWDATLMPPGRDPAFRETVFGNGWGLLTFYVDDVAELIRIFDPTASSGLPVSLQATGACSLDSDTSPANVTITGTGQCSITASQGGDTDYSAAQNVTQTFSIALANQTISFASLPNQTYGAGPITLGATASSGLPITYYTTGGCAVSGDTLTIVSGGTCTVLATQPGDANYNPAPDVEQSFNVAPANQTISFSSLSNKKFSGTSYTLHATASSGLPISYSVGATDPCAVSGPRSPSPERAAARSPRRKAGTSTTRRPSR
jgi:hypothetical protein